MLTPIVLKCVVLEATRCGAAVSVLEMVRELGKCSLVGTISGLLDDLRGLVKIPVVAILDIVDRVSLVRSFVQKKAYNTRLTLSYNALQ